MKLEPDDVPAMLGVHPWDSRLALFERLSGGADRRWWIEECRRLRGAPEPGAIWRWAPWDVDSWLEAPPRWVYAIAQAEMVVTGAHEARVTIIGQGIRRCRLGLDRAFLGELEAAEACFLEAVERREAPLPAGPDDLAIVKRLWPDDDEGEIRLPPGAVETWDRIKSLRKIGGDAEKRRKQLEAELRFALGAHRFGVLADGRKIRLATQADNMGRVSRRLVESR